MTTSTLVWGVAALAASAAAGAAEFPLQVRNLTIQEARSSPGGYGAYGMLVVGKPPGITKAPQPVSAHPLYGQTQSQSQSMAGGAGASSTTMFYVVDESKGTGKGYDRMIADLNRNGDLTDDPVWEAHSEQQQSEMESAWFGPVEMPADRAVGQWRPRFYAEMYLFNKRALGASDAGRPAGIPVIGQLRVMAANRLEADVEVNGIKQKVALVDGNCNFVICEPATLAQVKRGPDGPVSWYLSAADCLLRDRNGSGQFERGAGAEGAEAFSSVVYFAAKPFVMNVQPEMKTIQFEPYTAPVGELLVRKEVAELVIAREVPPGRWEVLTPEVKDGKVILPRGAYRVATCALRGDTHREDWVRVASSEPADKTFKIEEGQTTALELGLPMTLKVTATRQPAAVEGGGLLAGLKNLFGGAAGRSDDALNLQVNLLGVGGERYTSFSTAKGQMAPPQFEISDAAGKTLATGKFEFG